MQSQSSRLGKRKSDSKSYSPKKPKFVQTKDETKNADNKHKKSSASADNKNKKSYSSSPKDYKSAKPNFQLVENLKSDWNKVRVKTLSSGDRSKLMNKMAEKVKGKILQITLRHDVSRIVQSILQFGSNDLRSAIVKEISSKVLDISKTPYGHFTVLKIIAYCNALTDQTVIANALSGHFVSIGTNVIGARIVESILQLYPSKLTKPLKAEFYGKNFKILLGEAPRNLKSIIEALPNKVSNVLDHMRDIIQKLIEKGLLEFAYVHDLLYEYVEALHASENYQRIEDLAATLGDNLPKLITTKPGSKAVTYMITYANAKTRKNMMKSLKSKVLESLLHPSGHLAVIRLIQLTDDVVNVQKMLINEINATLVQDKFSASGDLLDKGGPALLSLALSPYGSKLLHFLLSNTLKFLEPDEKQLFLIPSPTSKKTDIARKRDHLMYMKNAMTTIFNNNLHLMIRNRSASKVIQEVIRVMYPNNIVGNLARTLTGLEIINDTNNVSSDVHVSDNNNDDDYEDDNVYEIKDVNTNIDMDGTKNDDDDEFDNTELAEFDMLADEFLEDGGATQNKSNTKTSSKVKSVAVEPTVEIYDDPVTHIMIKQILNFERQHETGETIDDKEEPIDESLWDQENLQRESFGYTLLSLLLSENMLPQWLLQNRSTFVIAWCSRIPSARKLAIELKSKETQKIIKSQEHQGSKVLLEELSKL